MTGAHVVGGTVAAMSAARSLANHGIDVTVSVPPGPVGGGFSPIPMSGRQVELGCRIIELSYDQPAGSQAPPLSNYRPGPHGHRPYTAIVDTEIRRLAGDALMPVITPTTRMGAATVHDWVFDGDLSGVSGLLSDVERASMRAQVVECIDRWGPRGWFDPAHERLLIEQSMLAAGRAHMGGEFHHRFIETFAGRILEGGSSVVEAGLHRKIWLPLFWPSTVLEAIDGELSYRPDRPFFTVAPRSNRLGGMGSLVGVMRDELAAMPSVTFVERSLVSVESQRGGTALGFSDGSSTTDELAILAGSPREVFGAVGVDYQPQMGALSMAWLELPEGTDVPDVLWIGDPDRAVYRMSRSWVDAGPPVVCCELAWWAPQSELADLAAAELVRVGLVPHRSLVRDLGVARRDALVLPSAENRFRFEAARSEFDRRIPGVVSCGPAVAFAVDSFNEQLIGGMVAADQWSRATGVTA